MKLNLSEYLYFKPILISNGLIFVYVVLVLVDSEIKFMIEIQESGKKQIEIKYGIIKSWDSGTYLWWSE